MHRIITLNPFLVHIGLQETNLCTFCSEEKETIIHVFYLCSKVQKLWAEIFEWLGTCNLPIIHSLQVIVLNNSSDTLLDKLVLIVKYYIYVTRCKKQDLVFIGALKCIKRYNMIEKNMAIMKGKLLR